MRRGSYPTYRPKGHESRGGENSLCLEGLLRKAYLQGRARKVKGSFRGSWDTRRCWKKPSVPPPGCLNHSACTFPVLALTALGWHQVLFRLPHWTGSSRKAGPGTILVTIVSPASTKCSVRLRISGLGASWQVKSPEPDDARIPENRAGDLTFALNSEYLCPLGKKNF